MSQKITIAVLAERLEGYQAVVVAAQADIKEDVTGIKEATKVEHERIFNHLEKVDELGLDHETRISKGEGTISLLVKLVIGSVVVSVGAVAGLIGRAIRLW